MRHPAITVALAALLLAVSAPAVSSEEGPRLDVEKLPGVGPLSTGSVTMSEDQLVSFFERQRKGTPLEITLQKGKVVRGLFSSYDDYYGTVWLVPRGDPGVFSQKGYRVSGIRSAAYWERGQSAAMEQEPMGGSENSLLKEMEKQ